MSLGFTLFIIIFVSILIGMIIGVRLVGVALVFCKEKTYNDFIRKTFRERLKFRFDLNDNQLDKKINEMKENNK